MEKKSETKSILIIGIFVAVAIGIIFLDSSYTGKQVALSASGNSLTAPPNGPFFPTEGNFPQLNGILDQLGVLNLFATTFGGQLIILPGVFSTGCTGTTTLQLVLYVFEPYMVMLAYDVGYWQNQINAINNELNSLSDQYKNALHSLIGGRLVDPFAAALMNFNGQNFFVLTPQLASWIMSLPGFGGQGAYWNLPGGPGYRLPPSLNLVFINEWLPQFNEILERLQYATFMKGATNQILKEFMRLYTLIIQTITNSHCGNTLPPGNPLTEQGLTQVTQTGKAPTPTGYGGWTLSPAGATGPAPGSPGAQCGTRNAQGTCINNLGKLCTAPNTCQNCVCVAPPAPSCEGNPPGLGGFCNGPCPPEKPNCNNVGGMCKCVAESTGKNED